MTIEDRISELEIRIRELEKELAIVGEPLLLANKMLIERDAVFTARIKKLEAALMEARELLFEHTPANSPGWEEQRNGWADALHNIDTAKFK